MTRTRSSVLLRTLTSSILAVLAVCGPGYLGTALAEAPAAGSSQSSSAAPAVPPENVVLQALRANPVTAPYAIMTRWKAGQVVLSGRVGTRVIHDSAVRTAIACGYSIRDDLVIDTSETYRVAAAAAASGASSAPYSPSYGPAPYYMSYGRSPYYVYPPPLFGRLDDPFFGFEPPLLSYPAWWRALAAREPLTLPGGPAAGATTAPNGVDPNTRRIPLGNSPQDGSIEMTLDAQGVAVLRGTVPSLADRVSIGQQIAQLPGVTQVTNLLEVGQPRTETPPPPPQPDPLGAQRAPAAPAQATAPEANAPHPAIVADRNDLARRLKQSFANRPALANLPIEISVRDGVAYLGGKVPSVYEAMLAFRVAQQTPGVRSIDDRLEFAVPDGQGKNPLRERGRPEDVEPYLAAQISRQVSDFAHVDQVRVRGDTLEIRGSVIREEDKARLDAILRSMPILRGFRLEPAFVVD